MTEATEVATATTTTAVARRTIGQDAEAALRERSAKAGTEELIYMLRGEDYRLLVPTPAATLLNAALAGEDFSKIIESIRSAFHPDDAEKFVTELMRTDVEFPADIDFLTDLLGAIIEATSSRPANS